MTQQLISLAGNIGVGKTTVAKIIQQHFGYELFEEPVIDNRFLKSYYADMHRWSFTLQMEFLIKRFEHVKLIQTIKKDCVMDRTTQEDPEVFARYLHATGKMNDNEYMLYLEYFRKFNETVRQPDKIIYLQNKNDEMLLDRIVNVRGREEEKNMSIEFLQGLNGLYELFPTICKEKYNLSIYTINKELYDIKNEEQKRVFIGELERIIKA